MAAFVAELRHLTEHCKFHAGELSERLRDQLVVGVNDEAIHRRLFAEPDGLTFDRALELALSVETAAAKRQRLAESYSSTSICRSWGQRRENQRTR